MNIIEHPLATEKAIRMIDTENKLVFAVGLKAKKAEIKKEIEELFKVKVTKVNTRIGPDGKKRAFIRLDETTPAIDLATKLGIM